MFHNARERGAFEQILLSMRPTSKTVPSFFTSASPRLINDHRARLRVALVPWRASLSFAH